MAAKTWISRRHRIRNNLRVFRAMQQLTQEDVAFRLGFQSRFRYWELENEMKEPTAAELKRLCRLFRCTEDELFPPKARLVAR